MKYDGKKQWKLFKIYILKKNFSWKCHYIIKKNNQAVKPSYGISSIGTYSPQYLDPCYLHIIT